MAGKKWCEYCRINLPYNKKAIEEHQTTRLHVQNKAKHIKFERIKIQREDKIKKQALKANSLMSTANIPKAKKGSQLDKQVEEYRNDVITSGKMAIHQLIAEKTKGLFGAPIQYPQKEDLVLAENYIDEPKDEQNQKQEDEKYEMWKIDICQQTGQACFINRISQAKVYEPPKGYVMSQQQKQEWEETKKICEQGFNNQNGDELGIVGEWEQMEQQQDYFQKNKLQSEQQQAPAYPKKQEIYIKQQIEQRYNIKNESNFNTQMVQKQKDWMQNLQQKIQNNQVSESQVISTVLNNTLQECRNVKQKNEALKKLIKSDFEIRSTLAKNDEELLKQQQANPKKSIGIKPRKKVKICQIIDDNDIV